MAESQAKKHRIDMALAAAGLLLDQVHSESELQMQSLISDNEQAIARVKEVVLQASVLHQRVAGELALIRGNIALQSSHLIPSGVTIACAGAAGKPHYGFQADSHPIRACALAAGAACLRLPAQACLKSRWNDPKVKGTSFRLDCCLPSWRSQDIKVCATNLSTLAR